MAGRRGKGEGGISKRKDGRWIGQYTLDTAAGAKRKTVYGKTKREVAAKLAKAVADRDNGLIFEGGNVTTAAYLDRWLQDSVKDTVRPRTFDRYGELCRNHIMPVIGRVRLNKLTPARVQALYRAKLDEGLSPTTVQHIHTTLYRALKQALKWGMVPRNVCEAVDAPRRATEEVVPLTPDQARKLLSVAAGEPLEALYTLALTTGARQGELLGLRWSDFEPGRIRIRRALVTDSRGKQWFGEPKTAKGRRTVSLTDLAGRALEAHRQRQIVAGLHNPDGLVFCNSRGNPLDPNNVLKRSFRPLLKRAGLPRIKFHTLRHTAATLLLSKNVNPKIVQGVLGHATIAITLDVYSHILEGMQSAATDAMSELFEGETGV